MSTELKSSELFWRRNAHETGLLSYAGHLPESGTVKLKLEGGPYTLRWTDARSGRNHHSGETTDGTQLKPPSEDGQWLLELVKQQ